MAWRAVGGRRVWDGRGVFGRGGPGTCQRVAAGACGARTQAPVAFVRGGGGSEAGGCRMGEPGQAGRRADLSGFPLWLS